MADENGGFGPIEITDGWRDLDEFLRKEDEKGKRLNTYASLAETLGVTATAVRSWAKRLARPTAGPLRDALCRVIESLPERWETTAEAAERDKFAKIGIAEAS